MIEQEILNEINSVAKRKSKPILNETGVYAVNIDDCVGVAIECDENVKISESFNNALIANTVIANKFKEIPVVLFYVKAEKMSSQYGSICLDFIRNKNIIQKNPEIWYNEWKELLGNSKKDQLVYDVIGEMRVLLELQRKKLKPVWESTHMGTFDITTSKAIYEVKSSQLKTTEIVEIHNQFQLEVENLSIPLFIAYCKVEKNATGDSIDSLYEELVRLKYNKQELDCYLEKIGYGVGKQARSRKYIIHEIRLYPVDEKFPKITNGSFKSGKAPQGIIKYQYTVSLDGLEYIKLV